jgi:hypothetical protein
VDFGPFAVPGLQALCGARASIFNLQRVAEN